ncbi:NAD-binding protein [Candidatus Woesearchaeota archaeon]|nr:NAD-binding protein [Candidatus Woesearchaeota archaeon]
MKVIIVGGGETSVTLANLIGEEEEITVVEKDEALAKALANKVKATVINGDGTDISILKEAGIENADAVVAATSDDSTNVMICQIAKTENIRKIVPLVRNPKNEELFTKLGITSMVSVAGTNARGIIRMLRTYGEWRVVSQLGEGDVQIIEQVVSKKSKLVGKKAAIKKAVVATIYRKGELIIPTPDSVIQEGDVVLVAVKTKDLLDVVGAIKGE